MSNIATRHNVVPFVSGESKPFSEQRLAKVGYKTTAKTPAKFPSVCASVPFITGWSENQAQRLRPYFVNLLQDTQDKVIRSLYESKEGNLSSVSDEDISIDQCISYLESEATGDRLTKDRIVSWFDENLRDNLTVVIAEKLGTQDTEDTRVVQSLNGYRALYGSLSKDSGALQDQQIKGLRRALEVCSVDDEIGTRLASKLDSMMNRPAIAELLEI